MCEQYACMPLRRQQFQLQANELDTVESQDLPSRTFWRSHLETISEVPADHLVVLLEKRQLYLPRSPDTQPEYAVIFLQRSSGHTGRVFAILAMRIDHAYFRLRHIHIRRLA